MAGFVVIVNSSLMAAIHDKVVSEFQLSGISGINVDPG